MIKDLLQQGFILKQRGHYKKAIEVFYKALEQDNASSELLLEIAELYYKLGDEERAISYIEQILDNIPEHINALKLLKQIFLDKEALREAEQTAKNIYCISNNENDLAEIFKLLNLQEKFDEIFEYNVESMSSAVLFEKTKALYKKQDFVKAEEIAQNLCGQNPNDQEMLLLLGQIYYAENKKNECVELAKRLSIKSKNPEILNFCALIEDYQGNCKQACALLQKAIKLNSKNDKYYYNLANIYFKQGNKTFAKKYYNIAISLYPENTSYKLALSNLYFSEQHYKRALEELPDNLFEANILKVMILYNTGYLALARKELLTLIKTAPDNPILLEYRSKINSALGINR